jgi:cell fate (sporulation/competence/biofilm development) regulator YlbF (YheA/YmcA/DUF963 family)
MEKVIEMARQLGEKLARHERTLLLKQAQEAVNKDPVATELIKQYQEQAEKIQQLQEEQKPIEVEDKHKLREIEEKISTNNALKEMTRRQVDFVEMMRKVKEAIDKQLEINS